MRVSVGEKGFRQIERLAVAELVLRQRLETIDQLNGKLEQSRAQVRRLGLQNEVLVAMIAAPDGAMLAAK